LNIDWLLDLARDVLQAQGVVRSRGDVLQGLDSRILDSAPARVLYHPYISLAGERGPFMESSARAMFTGLDVNTNFAEMMRGVFEGLCYASRDCYGAMGDIPAEVRVTGGAARSTALRLMLASTLNAKIRTVLRDESGAAGAAMIAAVQQNLYPDMASCVAEWVDPSLGPITESDAALANIYDKGFANYKSAREAMRPIWRAMHGS
jgi:erythritol kinase (D-erythritol 1-phosphate-forming)